MVLFSPKYRLANPENYLLSLSKKYFLDQNIQEALYLILKTEALVVIRLNLYADTQPMLDEYTTSTLTHLCKSR